MSLYFYLYFYLIYSNTQSIVAHVTLRRLFIELWIISQPSQ